MRGVNVGAIPAGQLAQPFSSRPYSERIPVRFRVLLASVTALLAAVVVIAGLHQSAHNRVVACLRDHGWSTSQGALGGDLLVQYTTAGENPEWTSASLLPPDIRATCGLPG